MSPPRKALTRRLLLMAGCAMLVAPEALAHRSQTVLTTIVWNDQKSILEVTHRFHNADAEAWLGLAGGKSTDITQVANQARLMLYVEDHFALLDGSRKIALEPLGAEFEGESILIYQECRLAAPPRDLAIENRILRDIFEGQANLVNVRLAQRTRTLIFAGQTGVQKAGDLF